MLTSAYMARFFHPDLTPLVVTAGDATGVAGTSGLVQYGALGIVASAAIAGLYSLVRTMQADHKEALKRERENIDRVQTRLDEARAELKTVRAEWAAEVRDLNKLHGDECRDLNKVHADEVRDLHKKNVETVIPALTMAAEAARDMQALARETQEFMRDLSRGGASR